MNMLSISCYFIIILLITNISCLLSFHNKIYYNCLLSSIKSNQFQSKFILQQSLQSNNNCNDLLQLKSFNNIFKSLAILSVSLFPFEYSFAASTSLQSSESIDIRRVMEKLPEESSISTKSTVRLPSGVEYYDVVKGDENGPQAEEGRTVQFQWVLRRSNGYFVDSSAKNNNEPFIYKVGNTKKVIKGIDEAIRGMRVGGIRRVNIPPKLAFVEGVEDGKPGPIPNGFGPRRQVLTRLDREVWYFEILLTKVK